MSGTIQQIRELGDSVFAGLHARADALMAHLVLSKQQATQRIERQKQAVRELLDRLQAGVQRQDDMAVDVKRRLASEIDGVKAQIERVIPIALNIDLCPSAGPDRADAIGIVDQELPCLPACLDNGLVAVPDQGAELVGA